MKKSHAHNELSNIKCVGEGCEKLIKARMAAKGRRRCYGCYKKKEAARGHFIDMHPRKKRVEKGLPVKNFKKIASWG